MTIKSSIPPGKEGDVLSASQANEATAAAFKQSLTSLRQRRAIAFCNNLSLARILSEALHKELGVDLTVKRVDRYTDLRAFFGDPHNSVSFELSDFYRLAKSRGLLFIEVLEISAKVILNLQLLEPLLPRGAERWRIPDYVNFGHIEVDPKFYIAVSFPSTPEVLALPPGLSSRLDIIELPPHAGAANSEPTMGAEVGPGTVLVLMKFGIEAYEQWYGEVLRPLAEKLGTCVRIEGALEDWQSQVTRAIDRADAVIVDLSHDLTQQFSRNVLWELNRLWQSFKSEEETGVRREKIIFIARGLESISSQNPQRDFVYASEVNKNWIPNLPTSAMNVEELFGFEIRRYDPADETSRGALTAWLENQLTPLVQNIPSPLTDSELRRRAEDLRHDRRSSLETKWLIAISERDFQTCRELEDDQEVPLSVIELLGDLMTTVTVSQAVSTPGYWGLVNKALKNSPTLRDHYRALLATKQLFLDAPLTSSFCENVWLAFTGIDSSLPIDEKKQLAALALREKRMYMREVSDHFRFAHLPEDQQEDAIAELLREHLASDHTNRY
jgi:hypothetical protein